MGPLTHFRARRRCLRGGVGQASPSQAQSHGVQRRFQPPDTARTTGDLLVNRHTLDFLTLLINRFSTVQGSLVGPPATVRASGYTLPLRATAISRNRTSICHCEAGPGKPHRWPVPVGAGDECLVGRRLRDLKAARRRTAGQCS